MSHLTFQPATQPSTCTSRTLRGGCSRMVGSRVSVHLTAEYEKEGGCKVRTQDPENFDEEVKSLVSAWRWKR